MILSVWDMGHYSKSFEWFCDLEYDTREIHHKTQNLLLERMKMLENI